jgi:hypothetical protein
MYRMMQKRTMDSDDRPHTKADSPLQLLPNTTMYFRPNERPRTKLVKSHILDQTLPAM